MQSQSKKNAVENKELKCLRSTTSEVKKAIKVSSAGPVGTYQTRNSGVPAVEEKAELDGSHPKK